MTARFLRRGALLGLAGLAGGLLPAILLGASAASAGTQVTTNACQSNATGTYSDIDIAMVGTASPDPVTFPGTTTLSGASFQASLPATLLIAGYNLGLLTVGVNNIPVNWWVSRTASSTVEGQHVQSGSVGATTTISDPDGTPGTGDETATPLNVNRPLANWTVTPTGGTIEFRQGGILPQIPAGQAGSGAVTPAGSVFYSASVAGGLIRANFDCRPGLTDADGPDNILGNADDATTFTSTAPASPFDTVTVNGGPTTTSTTSPTTTTTTLPGTPPGNKCAAMKLKAAGKKAACLLGANAMAAKKGQPVDGDKVQRCKDRFSHAFAKAETNAPCLTTADASAIEDKVDVFVDDVTSDLMP